MRNSAYFKEASIVANYALKRKHPLESIKFGIYHLRMIRKARYGDNFSDAVFNQFIPYYEKCAEGMIKSYLEYRECKDYA